MPRKIVITGSECDYAKALKLVTEQKDPKELGAGIASAEDDCAICWTEAESPVRTQCKHTYCAECFERLCFSGSSGNQQFCIRCEGDSGNCRSTLSLDELGAQLSSDTFECLLKASFASR